MPAPPTLSASAALAAFAEPLCAGRRVLVLGSALSSLPELLLQRGSRLVHVCDPDGARAAQAAAAFGSNKLSFAPLSDGLLPLRDAAFDVALIENLAAFDPVRTLREVRRVLGQRGVALVACPNRETSRPLLESALASKAELDYYALYDSVSAEFQQVRMLGQAPFVGYAIAEFSPEGEIEPVIDSGFLPRGSEEPEYFIALAAQQRAKLEAYSLVQLPARDVLAGAAGAGEHAELERLSSAERQHRRRIAELESMLKRSGQGGAVTSSLEHKLARQDAWIRELESRAAIADERADQAELELEELRREVETLRAAPAPQPAAPPTPVVDTAELTRVQGELTQATERLTALDRDLLAARATLAERDQRLQSLLGVEEGSVSEELGRLEQQLVERGHEVRRLERDIREAERIGRELVDSMKRKPAVVPEVSPDPELLRRLAVAEADRLAAVWAAEALAARLEQRTGEPGGLLAAAQAEIQRRDVLIAQLSASRNDDHSR